jgi:hypothetical protein
MIERMALADWAQLPTTLITAGSAKQVAPR